MVAKTPNCNLSLPSDNDTGWGQEVNQNFTDIDTLLAARMVTPAGTPAVGDMIAWSGSAWVRVVPAANKVLIGVGGAIPSFATLMSTIMTVNGNIDMLNQYRLINLPDPTAAQHPVTKAYADSILTAAAALIASISGKVLKTTVISSTQSLTMQAGTTKIDVFLIGAGGGGGSNYLGDYNTYGGGGSVGTRGKAFGIVVIGGQAYTVTVGTSSQGNDGGATSIVVGSTTYSAPGGKKGTNAGNNTNGSAGAKTSDPSNLYGTPGKAGVSPTGSGSSWNSAAETMSDWFGSYGKGGASAAAGSNGLAIVVEYS